MKNATVYLASLLLLAGCMKDELPVPAAPRGDASSHQVCMGSGYSQQLWFDLGTGAVVNENTRADWDLALESNAEGWRVMLNGARLMTAWNIGSVDITLPHDTLGMYDGRRIDAPSGDPDSTAVGDWRNMNNVYVVDLGYSSNGSLLGQRKVRFLSVDGSAFTLESTAMDGGDHRSAIVTKDPTRSFTYFSFDNGTVPIEPPMGTWDLLFTQYTHQFYDPYLPYLVNGVLVDGSRTRVARIVDRDFASVTLTDTLSFPFERKRNTIGYDWKYYSFETSAYTMVPDLSYIVQDAQGYFYKLRFLEFYGPQGQSGCPLFETVPL